MPLPVQDVEIMSITCQHLLLGQGKVSIDLASLLLIWPLLALLFVVAQEGPNAMHRLRTVAHAAKS